VKRANTSKIEANTADRPMGLTDIKIKNSKPDSTRTIKLSDGGGLQLWITSSGSKRW